MKNILTLLFALSVMTCSYASVLVEVPPKKMSEILLPVGNTGQLITLAELSNIKIKQWQELTGKKMSFREKVSFKLAQAKMKAELKRYEMTGKYAPIDFNDPVEKWMWFWIFAWGLALVFTIVGIHIVSALLWLFGSVALIIWLVKKFS